MAMSGAALPSPSGDPESLVRTVLDGLGVGYEWLPCDPDFADTAAFCERYGIDPDVSANTIVVASRRGVESHCACVALATTRLDVNGTVRRLMGVSKASFATPEETVRLTGMMIGGVAPFGLPEAMPLYIDAAVMERPRVVTGAGSRSAKVLLAPQALAMLPSAVVVAGLCTPRGE